MPRESEVHAHDPRERAGEFQAANARDAEREVHELLRALVRVLKPRRVIETGTAEGSTAATILAALEENGAGHLDTIEVDCELHARAVVRLQDSPRVSLWPCRSSDFLRTRAGQGIVYDFAFLDSDLGARVDELVTLVGQGLLRGHALIHDTSRYRAEGGVADRPGFPAELDEACARLGLRWVESNLSRGWRLVQVP